MWTLVFALTVDARLFRDMKFIMAHDSATSYLPDNYITKYVKTQKNSIYEMLECGVRAFDIRPLVYIDAKTENTEIIFHHGPYNIDVKIDKLITDVLNWTQHQNNTENNIVYLYINHCKGRECDYLTKRVLDSYNQNIYVLNNCTDIWNLSSDMIMKDREGAAIVATFECVNENYDSSITCFVNKDSCYETTENKPFEKYYDYVEKTMTTNFNKNGYLDMVQTHWQQSWWTVINDMWYGSSIIGDEERSNLNKITTEIVRKFRQYRFSIVEINNACANIEYIKSAMYRRPNV